MNISTRRKLIDEIKDYDKNINGRVANMQKQKILGMNETVEPYTQLNEQDIKKWKKQQIYLSRCQRKIVIINKVKDDFSLFTKDDKHLLELSQIETIKKTHIIQLYLFI